MDKPVELISLICLQCATPVPAQPDEVAWVCAQCARGLLLDQQAGLTFLEVNYATGIPVNSKGKPYWVAQGKVTLQRESYGGSSGEREAQAYWSLPRQFFIPAFSCSMEEMLRHGIRMMAQPPLLQAGTAADFEPVTLALEDAHTFAEFIVVAVEAGRKDKLKMIQFTLEFSSLQLWILPA